MIEEYNRDDNEAETVGDLLENILCGNKELGQWVDRDVKSIKV